MDAKWCKEFYFGLKSLPSRWKSGRPSKVTVLDLNKSVARDGRKAEDEFTEEWRHRHNYRGVYDAVWDAGSSILTCSVENTLQVWDLSSCECLAIHGQAVLKEDRSKECSCFHAAAASTVLVLGMTSGHIRTADMISGETIDEVRHARDYICDVKVKGDALFAIDCYGNLQEWRVESGKNRGKLSFVRSFKPVPDPGEPAAHPLDYIERYGRRGYERLIDFNAEYVASAVVGYVFISPRNPAGKNRFAFGVLMDEDRGDILCLSLDADGLLFSTIGGRLYKGDRQRDETSCDWTLKSIETRFRSNVTSIAVSKGRVVTGDVNGQIESLDKNSLDTMGSHSRVQDAEFVIESGHAPDAYIWCLNTDEARIISGDSDGKLVVHDFWDYRETATVEEEEPEQKKLKES